MPPRTSDKGKEVAGRSASLLPPTLPSDDGDQADQSSSTSVTPPTQPGSQGQNHGTAGPSSSSSSGHPSNPATNNPPGGRPPQSQPHIPTLSANPPIVPELTMIPMNIWTDPHLLRSSNNWKPWSSQMVLILRIYKAYAYLEGVEIRPDPSEQVSFANWRANHDMVCAFILNAIEVNERYDFDHFSRADELWRALVSVYDVTGIVSKMDAMSQLMSLTFNWTTPVTEHYRTVINLANTIFRDGPLSKDDIILHSLLSSLNNEAAKDHMKHARALLDSKPKAGHNDVYQYLRVAEAERKIRATKSNKLTALIASTKTSTSTSSSRRSKNVCANCKRRGQEEAFWVAPNGGMEGRTIEEAREAQWSGREEGKGKDKDKKPFKFKDGKAFFVNDGKVYSVDESGHVYIVAETIKQVASFVTDSLCQADFDELSLTFDGSYYSLNESGFLLGTGCTIHMSPFASDFTSLQSTSNRRITGVNGTQVEATGIGDIIIQTPSSPITLHNAFYVPGASVRLISVAALVNSIQGKIVFDNEKATILNREEDIIAHGTRIHGRNLWRLDGNPTISHPAFLSTSVPSQDVWHKHFGHSNNQSI